MRTVIPVFILLISFSSACESKRAEERKSTSQQMLDEPYSVKTAKKEDSFDVNTYQTPNGWGYRIVQGGKVLIEQPTIPGRPGVQGFGTENEARNVANFVCNKLKAKIFPPTVSEEDLKNLNIH